ncbi:hypothetical protein F4810DRAFT_708862 [Camillea tinctor]|nr:hypothetical protein F4810DRAFT_708862 [Camillea tinctor]
MNPDRLENDKPQALQPRETQGEVKSMSSERVSFPKEFLPINKQLEEAAANGRDNEINKFLGRGPIAKTERTEGKTNARQERPDDEGVSAALFAAIRNRRKSTAKLIVELRDVGLNNRHGDLQRTVLHEAIAMKYRDVVQRLLIQSDSVRYVNMKDEDGRTALHEAAFRGYHGIMRDLLANRADINATDNQNLTPLHVVVVEHGSPSKIEKTLEILLAHGAEVNTRDVFGDSPLHDASRQSNYNVMRLLLEYGADPDSRNNRGDTPKSLIPNDSKGDGAKVLFHELRGKRRVKYPLRIPENPPQCSGEKKKVCDQFLVTVRFYWRPEGLSWSQTTSVSSLVYDKSTLNKLQDEFIHVVQTSINKKGKIDMEVETKDIWKWIHLPANNISWVKDLIWHMLDDPNNVEPKRHAWRFLEQNIKERRGESIRKCIRIPHVEDDNYVDPIWASPNNPDGSGDSPDGIRPGIRRAVTVGPRIDVDEVIKEAWRSTDAFPKPNRLSLVLPFIDFESELYIDRHKNVNSQSWHFRRMFDLEKNYVPYTGLSGLQTPQTLDESYYDMLSPSEMTKRDQDQVVFKYEYIDSITDRSVRYEPRSGFTEFRSRQIDESLGNSQENETAVDEATEDGTETNDNAGKDTGKDQSVTSGAMESSTTKEAKRVIPKKQLDGKEAMSPEPLKKLLMIHQLWLWKLDDSTVITSLPERWHIGKEDTLWDTIRQSGIDQLSGPEDLIKHIVFECVTFLDEFREAGLGDHILDIFESAIATLSNEEIICYKNFIDSANSPPNPPTPADVDDGTAAAETPRTIDEEIRWIYEIKDIRDELHLLHRIFEAQAQVVDKFAKLFWPGFAQANTQLRAQFVEDCAVAALMERTGKLDEDAKRTLEALDYLVQVKQAQSSLDEAMATKELNRKSQSEAEKSQKLNNYIVLFTVVTVVFTPLSFMTSLFAVDIDRFPHQDGSLKFSEPWILGRMFAGELATLSVVLLSMYFLWVPRSERAALPQRIWERFRPARSGDSIALQGVVSHSHTRRLTPPSAPSASIPLSLPASASSSSYLPYPAVGINVNPPSTTSRVSGERVPGAEGGTSTAAILKLLRGVRVGGRGEGEGGNNESRLALDLEKQARPVDIQEWRSKI